MSKPQCPRTWEVEAIRDGRLRGPAREALQLHMRTCAACTREHAALEQLAAQLRDGAAGEVDHVGERRLRQQILAEANRTLLQPRSPSRRWLRPSIGLATLALIAALSLRPFHKGSRPAPAREPLQLTAADGARFMHERRQNLEYIELYEGSLDIRFDHRAHIGLVVRTPDGEVHDFGTTFRVTVARGHTAAVSVREGAVLLQRRGFDDLLLRAGEEFQAASEPEPAVTVSAEPPPPSAASDAAVPTAPQRAHAVRGSGARAAAREHTAASAGGEDEDRSYLHVLELVHAGHAEQARAAAAGYLRAFPNGFRRPEVERIAGAAR